MAPRAARTGTPRVGVARRRNASSLHSGWHIADTRAATSSSSPPAASVKTGLDDVRAAIDASLRRLGDSQTIESAIRALPDQYAPLNGPTLELQLPGNRIQLVPSVEGALYRIAREAFFNASRHGGASHIRVVLEFQPEQVSIHVSDSGLGIRRLPQGGTRQPASGIATLANALSAGDAQLGHGPEIEHLFELLAPSSSSL